MYLPYAVHPESKTRQPSNTSLMSGVDISTSVRFGRWMLQADIDETRAKVHLKQGPYFFWIGIL